MKIKLKHVSQDVDRHGNVRTYVRMPGQPKVRIRAYPGSEEFMDQYHAALAGLSNRPPQAKTAQRGSFQHLCRCYYDSDAFRRLDESTQKWQRRALDRISIAHGAKPVALMKQKHVRQLRDELSGKPGAAKTRLKALRALFRWAVEADAAPSDPTTGVKAISYVTKGHHTWTDAEVAQYEARHPLGSKARLALDLMLYSGCRREDVVRLGPPNLRDDRLIYRQAKNEHRYPVEVNIPVHPALARSIEAAGPAHMVFLTTAYAKPFTANGFGNAFKDWCRQADLPHCSAHGLRKVMSVRLAESGCSPHEIMAITGHRSLEEVENYTKATRRSALADSAMAKLQGQHRP